jgi:hypothetical protein
MLGDVGITVNINVCEHPEPVGELRRIYDTATETLGFRNLEQPIGRDIVQLKMMLNALGFFRPNEAEFDVRSPQANVYTQDAVEAVDKFRAAQGWQTTVPGFVEARTIERLWKSWKPASGYDPAQLSTSSASDNPGHGLRGLHGLLVENAVTAASAQCMIVLRKTWLHDC